ncbi:sigma 54-dependent transcriptional activator containing CheY-like receiver domain [Hahella chejuensis KCTC 2396]|uniref:Sigma 54-dependent transcriptional activator containing CheY-like receiver domain n=1 Tax=Hahella chejuensis (strain KCTC 2396) TaxID=349521 RepID=Q2SBV1_HAHCH|nr:sigma-54 dependent transcriptional regulator [Hahella chejuensis]ABC31873.1 sigma 54-dependent transcriptional activator containing CheY-like receiver domain [Hahella chejuensis KCTC 2396]
MNKPTLLIVEDDLELLDALTTTLEMNGYDYIGVDSAREALSVLEQRAVDMIISDVNMPGMNGFELMLEVRRQYPGVPVVLMTAYGQISQAVAAMQSGAADYLVKPFEPQTLLDTIEKYMGGAGGDSNADEPVAVDGASKRIFQLAQRVAMTDSTVLISGESGTGKEVLARYIHRKSARKNAPFVAINCAAIPENMLEAILFGHEKGAFTGAYASMPGKFEQADGGTILLDEISEMDLGLQAKLLRVLQEREVERIGGRKSIRLDVRVLATTNRDLKTYVQEGRFREDLYYRLSVFPIHWRPLRERRADIVPLAEHLLANHAQKMKLSFVRFDDSARQALYNHDWPGNVRELDNAIQRALILQQNGQITAADVCLEGVSLDSLTAPMASGMTMSEPMDEMEEMDDVSGLGQEMRMREFQIILDTLKSEGGRRNKVAEKLGISPRTLRYKIARMREFGIDIDEQMARAC